MRIHKEISSEKPLNSAKTVPPPLVVLEVLSVVGNSVVVVVVVIVAVVVVVDNFDELHAFATEIHDIMTIMTFPERAPMITDL